MECATEACRLPLAISCLTEGRPRDLLTGRASFYPPSLEQLPLEIGCLTGTRTPGLQRGGAGLTLPFLVWLFPLAAGCSLGAFRLEFTTGAD